MTEPSLAALVRNVITVTLTVFVGAAIAVAEPLQPSSPAEPTHRAHVVASGESLSEIAFTYYNAMSHYRLIQWVNRLPDEHHIVTGDKLIIPSASFFLEPHGFSHFSAPILHRADSKTGELFVGFYICRTVNTLPSSECPLSARSFVVTRLGRNAQNDLVFDRADFLGEPESAGELGSFEFIDLDGDGDVDILGEWSQGSDNVTTHIAYHYREELYVAHEIHSLSLGEFKTRRGPDGALQFIYYPRHEDKELVVSWTRLATGESPP